MTKKITIEVSQAEHDDAAKLAQSFGFRRDKFYYECFLFGLLKYQEMELEAKINVYKELGDALKPTSHD
jgi:hypothetical protein